MVPSGDGVEVIFLGLIIEKTDLCRLSDCVVDAVKDAVLYLWSPLDTNPTLSRGSIRGGLSLLGLSFCCRYAMTRQGVSRR